jgi:hypothetical protein
MKSTIYTALLVMLLFSQGLGQESDINSKK